MRCASEDIVRIISFALSMAFKRLTNPQNDNYAVISQTGKKRRYLPEITRTIYRLDIYCRGYNIFILFETTISFRASYRLAPLLI